MKNIFWVFGYGIPKDILKDENYNFYLKLIFNKIYSINVQTKSSDSLIICSGGKTDCFPPFKRNEADEMIKFLKDLSQKSFLKEITKHWRFVSEKKSLSTLENFLYCSEIVKKQKIKKAHIYIFCEQTRLSRIKKLTQYIKNINCTYTIIPLDFDISANRYLDPQFLLKKEKTVMKHDLWALKSSKNLKEYRKLFEEKLKFLRKTDPTMHLESIKKWWETKIQEFEKNIKK